MYYFIKRFEDEESAKAALIEFKKVRESFKVNGILSVAQFRRFGNVVVLPATHYFYTGDKLSSMDKIKEHKAFKLAKMVGLERGLYYYCSSRRFYNLYGSNFVMEEGTDDPIFYE